MTSSQRIIAIRAWMGACVLGGAAMLVGCEGEPPAPTPEETGKNQQNEMEARQKAYGKSGVPNVTNAKKAKEMSGATGGEAPAGEAPAAKK